MPNITVPKLFGGAVRGSIFSVGVSVPSRPGDVARRHWNRIVKEAMEACLKTHHKERIPLHFRQDARHKYSYKERSLRYRKRKRLKWHTTRDLVKTGASEQRMKREGQIVIGGAAEGSKKPIVGRLRLKFDFAQSEQFKRSQVKRFTRTVQPHFSRTTAGVTIADMHREVQRFTPQERKEFAEQLLAEIMKRYNAFQGSRQRKRMPGSGGGSRAAA